MLVESTLTTLFFETELLLAASFVLQHRLSNEVRGICFSICEEC
jgi:hypothetical protein